MADVKYVRGDEVKVTQESFKEALEKEGWKVEVKKPKKAKKEDE
jgi:hypothetical protein